MSPVAAESRPGIDLQEKALAGVCAVRLLASPRAALAVAVVDLVDREAVVIDVGLQIGVGPLVLLPADPESEPLRVVGGIEGALDRERQFGIPVALDLDEDPLVAPSHPLSVGGCRVVCAACDCA